MTIKEAIQFELDNNFNVSRLVKTMVMRDVESELDINESACGSYINFYEFVDESISEVLSRIVVTA